MLFVIIDHIFGSMKSSHKSDISSNSKSIYSSSFKQVIKGVESLIEDDDETEISTFTFTTPAKTPTKGKRQAMTNGEKLQMLMKSPDLREKVTEHLKSNGYLDIFPIIKVQILSAMGGPTEFPVTQQELTEVFKRFENLERVMIVGNNTYAFFNDHLSAYFAERALNDLTFRRADVKMVLKWCQPHEYFEISHLLNFERNCPLPELSRTNSGPAPKYTCRFRIQIENQKEFQVARRIIGPKGNNMKKIIDTCSIEIGADPNVESDSIKLRLRGKGSGYKEGPNKTESEDPLHLCISCREQKAYAKACELVEGLLAKVYEQYRGFCVRTGRKGQNLQCLRMDCNPGQPSPRSKNSFYTFQQFDGSVELSESQIRMYVEARNRARRELNFMEADRIRSFLKNKGVILMDQKGGRGRGVEVTAWKLARM